MDLSSVGSWHAYDGDRLQSVNRNKCPALQSTGNGDWNRLFTHRTFAAPVTLRLWFEWVDNDGGNEDWYGLHFQLMQDNGFNYDFGIRQDGNAVFVQEYGNNNYTRLGGYVAHGVKPNGTRHQLEVRFGKGKLAAGIDRHKNRDGDDVGVLVMEDDRAHWKFPRFNTGRLGLRLDRQVVRLGSVVAV